MKKIILSLLITIGTLFLSGCLISSVVGTTIVVSNDRRTTGEVIDDTGIEFSLFSWSGEDKMLKDTHLNFMVYNKEVVITGEVPTVSIRNYITKQAPFKDFKIRKVTNEVRVAKNTGLVGRAKDSAITLSAKALFHNQEVFNPLHVEIMTENRTVYLMGALTAREADKATKIVSTIGGVERVVKLFHYLKARPAAEIESEKRKQLEAEKQAKLEAKRAIIKAKKEVLRRQIQALDSNSGTSF
ncbi:BON domain-containing protein [Candidatus Thiodubiliella endoseptemdiera]|uniref:BON domain-containing protein n=1 Tax=Candidatus Thiodubiliella endoseptemdiera TaxID=2738886 RepID=UPI0034DFD8EA